MLPTREEAKRLLQEGEYCNPGPWGNHSRIAGDCAQKIAQACGNLDSEKPMFWDCCTILAENSASVIWDMFLTDIPI